MFVFFSIFVCEKRKENTPICRAQSYKDCMHIQKGSGQNVRTVAGARKPSTAMSLASCNVQNCSVTMWC